MSRALGRVSQVSPLRVRVNGDTQDTPAENAGPSMSGASTSTEVLVEVVERRVFACRVGV